MSTPKKAVNEIVVLMEMGMGASGPLPPENNGMEDGPMLGQDMFGLQMDQAAEPTGAEEQQFNDEEMRLAKRFIDIIGSPEKAQELLDKAVEGFEYLGMVDDESADRAMISTIATAVPTQMDAPTMIANLASSFDPGQ